MFAFAKKGFYVSLGLASFTKEKAEAFAREFAKRTELGEEEGRRFADYLKEESGKAQTALSETVEAMVRKNVERLPCQRRLAALEQRVAKLEKLALDLCPDEARGAGIAPADAAAGEPENEETNGAEAAGDAGAEG